MPGQKLRFGLAAVNMPSEIETTRSAVQAGIASAAFRAFARQRRGKGSSIGGASWLPVAVLSPARLHALGFAPDTESVVRLSAETVQRHNKAPEMRFASFGTEDWRRVQPMLEGGRWAFSPDEVGENSRLFWRVESQQPWKAWRVIIKRAANGELYLTTYHKARLRQVTRWKKIRAKELMQEN